MATAQPQQFAIADLTECVICRETFKNPKCLPCIHTFCLKCLVQWGQDKRPGEEMPCPLCRQRFPVPVRGLDEMEDNLFVKRLLESQYATNSSESSWLIAQCGECSKSMCGYCVQCFKFFCATCVLTHEEHPAAADHGVVFLKNKKDIKFTGVQPLLCDHITSKQYELYCYDCDLVICIDCSLKHEHHRCENLEESRKTYEDEIKKTYQKLTACFEEIRNELKQLDANEIDFLKQIEAGTEAIEEQRNEVVRRAEADCERLKKQIKTFKIEQLNKMHARKKEAQDRLLTVVDYDKSVKDLFENDSPIANKLLTGIKKVVISQSKFSENKLDPVKLSFTPATTFENKTEDVGMIGQLTLNDTALIFREQDSVVIAKHFVAVGMHCKDEIVQRVCRIDLERPNDVEKVKMVDSTPTWIGSETAACVIFNTLYVAGIGLEFNELWKWNATSSWTKCADMASLRRRHCVSVVDSTLYVLGGWTYDERLPNYADKCKRPNIVSSYDTQTDDWSVAGQLKHAVSSAACVAYDRDIFVFGGCDNKYKIVDYVQMFDTEGQRCIVLRNPMPRACSEMRAVLWKSYAILLGHSNCFIYDCETRTWQERDDFKAGVVQFGLVIDYPTLYVVGGTENISSNDSSRMWGITNEIKSLSVFDVIENKPGATWKHHGRFPLHSRIHAFGLVPDSQKPLNQAETSLSLKQKEKILDNLKQISESEPDLTITNCAFEVSEAEIFYLYNGERSRADFTAWMRSELQPVVEPASLKLTRLKYRPDLELTHGPGTSVHVLPDQPDQLVQECILGAFVDVQGKGAHALTSGHGKALQQRVVFPDGSTLGEVRLVHVNDCLEGQCDASLIKLEHKKTVEEPQGDIQPTHGRNFQQTVFDRIGNVIVLRGIPMRPEKGIEVCKFEDDLEAKGCIVYKTFNVRINETLWRRDYIAIGRKPREDEVAGFKAIHEAGESGMLVTNLPSEGKVRAIGMLVGRERFEHMDDGVCDHFSLAVPIRRTMGHLSAYYDDVEVTLITPDLAQAMD